MDLIAILQEKLSTPLTMGHFLSLFIVIGLLHWNVLKAIVHVSAQVGDVGRLLTRHIVARDADGAEHE